MKALGFVGLIAVCLLVLPVAASADTGSPSLAVETVAGMCDANQAMASLDGADSAKVFAAQIQQAKKVCRGRCTYAINGGGTFTTPCSAAPACDCQASVNGHDLFQFSCGMVAVSPTQH